MDTVDIHEYTIVIRDDYGTETGWTILNSSFSFGLRNYYNRTGRND